MPIFTVSSICIIEVRKHIAIQVGNLVGDFRYAEYPHPFLSRHGNPRLGIHTGRIRFWPPDRQFKRILVAPLPIEFRNLFPRLKRKFYGVD